MSSAPTASDPPKPVPRSVQDADVVIVGGGPCGALAAMLFDQRGVSATVIERDADFLQFISSKAYPMGIFGRGAKATAAVPGLFEHIKAFSMPSAFASMTFIGMDSKVQYYTSPLVSVERNVSLFYRFRLLHVFKTFVQEKTNAKTMYGTEVELIDFKDDGSMDVHIKDESGEQILNTRLMLACDGKNSSVLKHLREAQDNAGSNDSCVQSLRGFAEKVLINPSVGRVAKSIILEQNTLDKFELKENSDDQSIVRLDGARKGRPSLRTFSAIIWPQNLNDTIFGGALAMITQPIEHALWKLKDIDEAFQLFQENFPQLNIRECITTESMETFLNSSTVAFPKITRPESLVATIGKPATGGVIIIGDAAHCFPPNLGLGVNVGFEDVDVLMRVIDDAGEGDDIKDIVKRYEEKRDDDVTALLNIVHKCSPYLMSDLSLLAKLWTFFLMPLRSKLSKLFPNVLYPSCVEMVRMDLSFSEIWKRGNISMFRIFAGIGILIGAPISAFLLAKFVPS